MNITRQNIDELNATMKLNVGKEDYEERVNKTLNDYRRKANMPGFRPGKVPASLINKMYRKSVLADEINKLVSEKINEYLKAEDLHVLGDPMPNESLTADREEQFIVAQANSVMDEKGHFTDDRVVCRQRGEFI